MLCCRRVDASVNGCRTGGRGFFSALILVTGGTSWHGRFCVSRDFFGCLVGRLCFSPVTSRVSARQPSYFFLLRQKKVTKKKASHVRAASRSLALLAAFGTLANSLRSNSASVLIRTLLRCSARPNGGGYHTARPLREPRPSGWFAALTSRGCWVASFLYPHIGIGGLPKETPLPHHPACGSAPGGSRA